MKILCECGHSKTEHQRTKVKKIERYLECEN